jgi:signal peptidase I
MIRPANDSAWLTRLLLGLTAVWLFRHLVWMPVLLSGPSMLPTLDNGCLSGILKLGYRFHFPHRGDIVAVWTGKDLIVKRIIGLPGEEIAARDGTFYIDGRALQEPYVQFWDRANVALGKIPADHFVIVGDNREQTLTAVVARSRILGRLWPRP